MMRSWHITVDQLSLRGGDVQHVQSVGNKQDRCHGIIDMAGSTAGPTPAAY